VGELAAEFLRRWEVHGGPPAAPPAAGPQDPDAGPAERASLAIDSSAARRELRWRPVLRFSEAVDLTAAWYAPWASDRPFDARAGMREQIETYQRLAAERYRARTGVGSAA